MIITITDTSDNVILTRNGGAGGGPDNVATGYT